jgi:hypothetical protein
VQREENWPSILKYTGPQLKDDSKLFGQNPLKKLPDPPCFPEFSSDDFCLFGKVKSVLIGWDTPDEINLPKAVTEILNCISDAELPGVF